MLATPHGNVAHYAQTGRLGEVVTRNFDRKDGIVFAPVENVVIADDYEVLISFPIGAITGADSAEPNDLTGSVQAAGSCIASPRAEEITRIVVNGEVVNHRTIAVHP